MNVFEGLDVGGPSFFRSIARFLDGLITSALTVGTTSGTVVSAGVITMYGAATAPANALLCDGTAVSRTTYATLFGVISTTFGIGDGSTTFNVPDFRGVFAKGAGTTNRVAGVDASGNAYAATLGTYSQDQMQGMGHTFANTTNGRLANNSNLVGGVAGAVRSDGSGNQMTLTHNSDGTNGTPRTGHTTEPQNLGITFIIYTGL